MIAETYHTLQLTCDIIKKAEVNFLNLNHVLG